MNSKPIEEVAKSSIAEYAHYITKSRVLPHLDMKPIHRRILWSLIELGARSGKGKYRKCASVVGHCLKYSPHGDASVYGALCHLVNTPNALISGRGAFSGIYGDKPASSRYTEARTSDLFEHILDPTMFELGDFIPNYDESSKEPVLFQTYIPIVGLNGINGIGVGLVTQTPALSFDKIKQEVFHAIGDPVDPVESVYSYGGVEHDRRIWPVTKITKMGNKEYLHITELPKTCNASILSSSKLIGELLSAKAIEIIDESTFQQTSIYIYAPKSIQELILQSMSLPLTDNLKYYWGRLRSSDYYGEWVKERLKYIKKREAWIYANKWEKSLIQCCVNSISNELRNTSCGYLPELAEKVTRNEFKDLIKHISTESKQFIKTEDEYVNQIQSKSISSISYKISELELEKNKSEDQVKQILVKEIENLDPSLFSKPSVKSIPVSLDIKNEIKKYVALRSDNSVEIRFNHISRVINWEATDSIYVVYSDGKMDNVNQYFFGTVESTDPNKKIVGFSLPNQLLVVITESNKLRVLSRLGVLNEPIKSVFPAKKISVNNKEYIVRRGMEINDVSNWKVLEV
jgi:hypothetical protein